MSNEGYAGWSNYATWLVNNLCEFDRQSCIVRDIINAFLETVDWEELAEAYQEMCLEGET